MDHYFCAEFAEKHGICEAILFYHIAYWTEQNQIDGRNYHDDKYWMYGSIRSMHENTHRYMNENQIRQAIRNLVDEGLILEGCYNKVQYDRTKWYTLSSYGMTIYSETQMLLSKNQNALREKKKPIPIKENNTTKEISDNQLRKGLPTERNVSAGN